MHASVCVCCWDYVVVASSLLRNNIKRAAGDNAQNERVVVVFTHTRVLAPLCPALLPLQFATDMFRMAHLAPVRVRVCVPDARTRACVCVFVRDNLIASIRHRFRNRQHGASHSARVGIQCTTYGAVWADSLVLL